MNQLASWWTSEARPRQAYALAAALGLAVFLAVLGPSFCLGTSDYWNLPSNDHRAYLMGYRYFVHEPWHWPIFETRTMNVPFGKSIAFTDSLPLWAFANKVIATVLPPWRTFSEHAFLGLWYALVSCLQAVLGVANLRALGRRTWGATIVGALFFLAIPAWTFRFLHASLYAHFLTLWAVYLYLRTPDSAPAPRRLRVLQLAQLAIAALINPYHTVMSLAVFSASLLRSRDLRRALAWFSLGAGVVVVCLALAGYFAHDAALSMTGFDTASTNVLAPLLPRRSGWFGDALWIDATGTQYEGMCYLGLGLLAVFAWFVPRARSVLVPARRHIYLVAVAAGAGWLALSNHIYVGNFRIAAYPVPRLLHWIPDQFRCPGRFVWLPMYVAVLFVLSRALARNGRAWQLVILPVLAVVQLVDVSGDWSAFRGNTDVPFPNSVDLAAWRQLLASSQQIAIYPSHDCVGGEQRLWDGTMQLQYLASLEHVPINGVYSARPSRDCDRDLVDASLLRPVPRALYVFVAPDTPVARRLAREGVPCFEFELGSACAIDLPALVATGWPPTSPVPELAWGQSIALAAPDVPYAELGWSWPEPDGRWSDGVVARLTFARVGDAPTHPVLKLEAYAALCGRRHVQDVDVAVSGFPIGTLHFDATHDDLSRPYELPLPRALLAGRDITIDLRPRDVRSPWALGCNDDRRELGVLVRRVEIAQGVGPGSR
jgi:hypothetical protein